MTTLFRPVGLNELSLIWDSGMREFPPRLPHQPIFYPVANRDYATQIARDWNTKDSSFAGYVTTLPHPFAIPQISKLGVLTLYGYGIRVTMQAGHLQIEDGIGPERRRFRLTRVNHRLKRLVCIAEDGFVTLSALKWLSEVGASFVMLDRLGKVRIITGPASSSE